MIKWIAELRARRADKKATLRSKPWVVVRQKEKVVWRKEDGAFMANVMRSISWAKLAARCEDSIIADALGRPGEVADLEWLRAFVAGKKAMLGYIRSHGCDEKTLAAVEDMRSQEDVDDVVIENDPDSFVNAKADDAKDRDGELVPYETNEDR
jgi:hypothetical protein